MTIDIAIAVIVHPTEDSILLGLRKADVHQPNVWEFPGGKCEPGETPREAAVREAREEVGLDVVPIQTWDVLTYEYPERTVRLHPFVCTTDSVDAVALGCARVEWVERTRLAEYEFPPANRPLIERLLSGR